MTTQTETDRLLARAVALAAVACELDYDSRNHLVCDAAVLRDYARLLHDLLIEVQERLERERMAPAPAE